jgi:hypothetical protein
MRALKVLIVIMGVLLVLGFALLGVMVVKKIQGLDEPVKRVQEVALPKGFEVIKIIEASERILIHLRSSNKNEEILLINAASGQEVARISTDQSESK